MDKPNEIIGELAKPATTEFWPECPDCGAGIGVEHHRFCDVAACTVCGHQRITCDTDNPDHDSMDTIWEGTWPPRPED